MIFIINSINTVFESLKEGIERDVVKIFNDYRFIFDKYTICF